MKSSGLGTSKTVPISEELSGTSIEEMKEAVPSDIDIAVAAGVTSVGAAASSRLLKMVQSPLSVIKIVTIFSSRYSVEDCPNTVGGIDAPSRTMTWLSLKKLIKISSKNKIK